MYKNLSEALALAQELKASLTRLDGREALICPPAVHIAKIHDVLRGSPILLGAQNLHWEAEGAFTGEISAGMIKSAGATHVIIGHSERRQYFGETDETVRKKTKAALKTGLIPIVCVGETLSEREAGSHFSVVERQVKEGLSEISEEEFSQGVIAYEPVWAIGTGKTATPAQTQEMHAFIRKQLSGIFSEAGAGKTRILYGGSVKPDNIDALMREPDIDGGLVGAASLKAPDFTRIVQYGVRPDKLTIE